MHRLKISNIISCLWRGASVIDDWRWRSVPGREICVSRQKQVITTDVTTQIYYIKRTNKIFLWPKILNILKITKKEKYRHFQQIPLIFFSLILYIISSSVNIMEFLQKKKCWMRYDGFFQNSYFSSSFWDTKKIIGYTYVKEMRILNLLL